MKILIALCAVSITLTFAGLSAHAGGDISTHFAPEQVSLGLDTYRQFCQRCHGAGLRSSGASTFDLRQFPENDRERFIESVTEGSGDMPPHGDILTGEEIDALYAYVVTTQRQNRQ